MYPPVLLGKSVHSHLRYRTSGDWRHTLRFCRKSSHKKADRSFSDRETLSGDGGCATRRAVSPPPLSRQRTALSMYFQQHQARKSQVATSATVAQIRKLVVANDCHDLIEEYIWSWSCERVLGWTYYGILHIAQYVGSRGGIWEWNQLLSFFSLNFFLVRLYTFCI